MKILKFISLSVLGIIGLLCLTLVGAWMFPEAILTPTRVDQLFDQYASPFFSKKPNQLSLALNSNDWNGKRVTLKLSNFCLKEFDACFDQFQFEFAFKISKHFKIKPNSIGPVDIINQSFTYIIQPAHEGATKETGSSISKFFEFPSNLEIKTLHLQFPQITLVDKENITHGSLALEGTPQEGVKLLAEAHQNPGLFARAEIETSLHENQTNPVKATLSFKEKLIHATANLAGDVNWNTLQGVIKGEAKVEHLFTWMKAIDVQNLKIERIQKSILTANLKTEIYPDIDIQSKTSALPRARFNPTITGKLTATSEDFESFHYDLKLGPYIDHGAKLDAWAAGVYPFSEEKKSFLGLDHFRFDATIEQFQELVRSLDKTRIAVPAPASQLRGKIILSVGERDAEIKEGTLPISFSTHLASNDQSFHTESTGTIDFTSESPKIKITGESKLQDVKITMPDIEILGPKLAFKYDSRISLTEEHSDAIHIEKPRSSKSLDLSWKIKSLQNGIQIYYPLFIPMAPLEVNWDIGKETSGEIKAAPFQIEYLKRKAKVTRLRYFLKPHDDRAHFEGNLVIPKTDYTISLDIFDEDSKPRIVFSSTPPLPESDIISVLLFNQTTAELDPDQTNSVASTQAAVANRALGLFSIFALSSTPIEAVNFNPASKIYSARVKLASGLTATVGTDWEKAQEVALRKRIGKNFVLSTIFQTDPDTNSETTKTLLEWFRRF